MSSKTRVAYSPTGTSMQRAIIKLGEGDWEITALSVVMGSTIPSFNGAEFGGGSVSFEVLEGDGETVLETHYLVSGRCTRYWPLVMDSPKRVKGPGRIRSHVRHGSSTEHTLTAIYRRVKD